MAQVGAGAVTVGVFVVVAAAERVTHSSGCCGSGCSGRAWLDTARICVAGCVALAAAGAGSGRGRRIFKLLARMLEICELHLMHEVEVIFEHASWAVVADTQMDLVESGHGHEAIIALWPGSVVKAKGELVDLQLDNVQRLVEACLTRKFIQNVIKSSSDGNNLESRVPVRALLG